MAGGGLSRRERHDVYNHNVRSSEVHALSSDEASLLILGAAVTPLRYAARAEPKTMDVLSLTVGLACILSALITIALAIPLFMGKVKRNALYGVRILQAFESEEAWLHLNRYGAKRLIAWSIPVFVLGVVALFIPLEQRPWFAVALGCAPLLVVGAAVQTVMYARRNEGAA